MSQAQNSPDCETLRALIPAYSVGATDKEETALVEKLLLECPEGAAELEDYLALSEAMLYAAPPVQPPAALHDKLMAAVSAESKQTPTPAALPPVTKPTSLASPAAKPVIASALPTRILHLNRYLAAAAAVAAALLILSNVYWVAQVNSLNQQQQTMTVLLRNQEDALTSLGTGKANHVQLVSTSSATSGNPLATVLWTPQSSAALIYSDNLPALAANQTYQLWFIQDSHPVSAGIFTLDQLGVGVLVFTLDHPMSAYSAAAISVEPVGGSLQPTTTPIAAAQLS